MTWRASARHVIGCRLTQETRIQNTFAGVDGRSARQVIGCHFLKQRGLKMRLMTWRALSISPDHILRSCLAGLCGGQGVAAQVEFESKVRKQYITL
jgi:hypothetical protein